MSTRTNYIRETLCGRIILATIAVLTLSAAFTVSAFGQGSSNYVFTTNTSGTFTDMSSGTTLLVGATADDASSPVTNIGFDFYLLGVRYTQFSANSNGFVRLGSPAVSISQLVLGTAGSPLIAAYGSDLFTSATGKVHFKVTGSAPNRVLTVEFLNETIILGGSGPGDDGTYQVRLYETTGVVEFVYGQMIRNDAPIANPQYVGFSTSALDNTYVTVNTVTNTANTTGGLTVNQPPVSTPIANLNTPVDGSRRTYSFTPPTPTAPTALNFTAVTPFAMTLNWTDSPDESLYAVYRSTDGINYNFEATVAANATSYPATGLVPSTTYFWHVFAVSDGAFSTALSGSQATAAPGSVVSTAAGGNWSAAGTWAGGVVPTVSDDVTIISGATVTIDTAAVAYGVTINGGGTLQYASGSAQTLTTGGPVTIDSGGLFQSATSGTVTAHILFVGTDLTNNGTLDFSTNADTAGAGITFTGATNNTFGGTGATTDIRTLTINKGTSNANILELNPTNFTVRGTTVDGAPMAFLTLTNGTLKLSGTFTLTGRVFTAPAYAIPATAGFWLNNPNFTVAGQPGSPSNNGLLRISNGTFNVGTISGNAMGAAAGALFIIEGGTFNLAGRLLSANAVTYTQSGGTVNVCTVGNAAGTTASFGLTSATSFFNMSGGTINLVQINSNATANNRLDYQVSSTPNITGGTLNVGTSATAGNAGNFDFRIRGQVPNLVIDNTTNNKNVLLTAVTSTFGNVTINTNTSLSTQGFVWNAIGTTITNNGTITVPTNNGRLIFLGTGPQVYTGSGTATIVTAAGSVDLTIDNPAGLTINSVPNGIITQRVNFLRGGITNSNKLTLGNGGATVGVVQYGVASGTNTAGNFDVAPTFNVGTGGQTIMYLQESTPRTTSVEIPVPSRTILNLTVNNTNGIIMSGDLTLSSGATALTLTNGRVITGANTLILSSGTAAVTRTNGYVDGNFRKTYTALGNKNFEVGTANSFSPVAVNVTALPITSTLTVRAVEGAQPLLNAAGSLKRYWELTEGGDLTATLTFTYATDALDVAGTEANYRPIRVSGGTAVNFPESCPATCVNEAANTIVMTGVSAFSDWTAGEQLAPTAAPATISGQVTTPSGAPLAGVTMYLSGGKSARTITDSNGNYRFINVDTENFYTVTPSILNHTFTPANLSFSLLANKTDATFTGTPNSVSSGNVIDTPEYFVRQHYLDFLGREPDDEGLNFWSDQILGCGNDFNCVERRTINVSAAYFLSIEFQETGGLVDRLYRASYGRPPLYNEFMPDAGTISQDLIVGQAGWEQVLATNKQEFLEAWVQRPAFRAGYDNLANDGYVDALIRNTSVNFTSEERDALLDGLNNSTLTRTAVLQRVAQDQRFVTAKFNEAFVRMEYFGYLRRDPDDSGFNFWLNKLNEFNGNFEQAEMVKAFITSGEYRDRFR